jgi:hypothetical protein
MKPSRLSMIASVLLVFGLAAGPAPARTEDDVAVDPLPGDTNTIESLTPRQAGRLVQEFPASAETVELRGGGVFALGHGLSLNGLKSLDAETAAALTRRNGLLLLDGLTSLSGETAKALAQHRHQLSLSGLTRLEADAAKALGQFKGIGMFLRGLTTIDAESAAALVQAPWDGMLPGLTTLDADTARALAKFKGNLHLGGLTTLEADVAAALAEYAGRELCLEGLTTFSAETAKALARCKCSALNLRGVTTLSDEAAREMMRAKGESREVFLDRLVPASGELALEMFLAYVTGPESLQAVTRLSVEAATALVALEQEDLSLPGLTRLDSPDSVRIAEILATHKGELALPRLERISPKALTALVRKEGVVIPLLEKLEFIQEPDGSVTEDFVIPPWLELKQKAERDGP